RKKSEEAEKPQEAAVVEEAKAEKAITKARKKSEEAEKPQEAAVVEEAKAEKAITKARKKSEEAEKPQEAAVVEEAKAEKAITKARKKSEEAEKPQEAAVVEEAKAEKAITKARKKSEEAEKPQEAAVVEEAKAEKAITKARKKSEEAEKPQEAAVVEEAKAEKAITKARKKSEEAEKPQEAAVVEEAKAEKAITKARKKSEEAEKPQEAAVVEKPRLRRQSRTRKKSEKPRNLKKPPLWKKPRLRRQSRKRGRSLRKPRNLKKPPLWKKPRLRRQSESEEEVRGSRELKKPPFQGWKAITKARKKSEEAEKPQEAAVVEEAKAEKAITKARKKSEEAEKPQEAAVVEEAKAEKAITKARKKSEEAEKPQEAAVVEEAKAEKAITKARKKSEEAEKPQEAAVVEEAKAEKAVTKARKKSEEAEKPQEAAVVEEAKAEKAITKARKKSEEAEKPQEAAVVEEAKAEKAVTKARKKSEEAEKPQEAAVVEEAKAEKAVTKARKKSEDIGKPKVKRTSLKSKKKVETDGPDNTTETNGFRSVENGDSHSVPMNGKLEKIESLTADEEYEKLYQKALETRAYMEDGREWTRVTDEDNSNRQILLNNDQKLTEAVKREMEDLKKMQKDREMKRKPAFEMFLTNRSMGVGSTVKLSCAATGPEYQVQWLKNGKPISSGGKYRIRESCGLLALEILDATVSDSGEYTCILKNRNGSVESSSMVTIYEKCRDDDAFAPLFTRGIRVLLTSSQVVPTMADVLVEKKPTVSIQVPQSIIKRGITPDVLRRSRSRRSRSVTPFLARQDRETTPYEIGQNVPHTLVSALCVLDQALVMDISSAIQDDPVQVLTSDFSVIDRASVMDISHGDFILEYEEYEEEIADDASIMSVDDRASELDESETRSERSESEAPVSEAESVGTEVSETGEGGEPGAKKKKVVKKKAVKKPVVKKKIVKKEESPKKKAAGKTGATPPPKAPPKKLAVSSMFNQADSAPKPPKPTKPQPKKKSKSPSPRPKGATPTKSAEEAAEIAKKAREPSKEPEEEPEEEEEEEEEGEEEGEEEEQEEEPMDEYQYDEDQEPEEEEEPTPKSPSPVYTEDDIAEQKLIAKLTVYEPDYDPDIWRKVKDEPPPPPIHLEFPPEKPRKGQLPYKSLTEKERDIEWQKERESRKPPVLLNHLTDRIVCEGTPVKLSCSVSGPDLQVKWLKNGFTMEKKPSIKTTSTDGYLVLDMPNPTPADSGVYECVVKNKNGELSTQANVTIYQLSSELHSTIRLSIERQFMASLCLSDSYDIYTDELIVEFHIRGQPRPQLEWAKDAIALDLNDERYRVVHEGNLCQLLISKPTINDSGKYVCFASNAAGKVEASHYLYFESKEAVTHVAGIFHAHSKKSLEEITDELMPHITLPERPKDDNQGERVKKEKPAAKGVKGGPKAAAAAAAAGKGRRKEETLLHRKILTFSNNLRDMTVNVGTKLKLTTTVIGPEPNIKWTKDGIGIAPSPRYKNSTKEGFACIELNDLTLDDSGVYACTAKNAAGEISTQAQVTVYAIEDVDAIAPIFTLPIRDTYHAAENDLILSCKVRAHPRPQIVWMKDEVEIPPEERIQQVEHANGVCELLIHAPSTKDSGTYSCTASNSKGMQKVAHRTLVQAQYIAPVDVQPRDEQKPKGRKMGKKKEKPTSTGIPSAKLSLVFQSFLTSRTVKEGQPVKLTCFVAGPDPNVKWLKDGAGFAPSPVLKVNNADGFLTCHFLSPKVEDSGEYSVLVKNSMSTITCSCRLDVYSAHLTSDFPPMFTRALKDNYHINTNELIIDSHIRGQPMPSVSWMKDGLTVNPDGTFQQFEHEDGSIEFVISDPQRSHSGRYICQLENHMGKAELSHYVLFEGREVCETEPVHGVYHVDHAKIREKEEAERRAREQALLPTPPRRESAVALEGSADVSPRKTVSKTPSRLDRVIHDAKTRLTFAAPLTNRVCAVGSKVKLSCYVDGHNPHFEWFKNNNPVNYSTTVRNSSRDGLGILEFFDAQLDDTGDYKCVVRNIAGEINSTATLMVYEDRKDVEVPPCFVIGLKDKYIIERDEILMECHVRGDPKPSISWMREGEPITDPRFQFFELDDGVCHLLITKPVPKDSGVYACIAENKLKREQTGHYLVFEGRDAELKKLEPEPEPEVKEPPKRKPMGKKAKAKAAAKAAEAGGPVDMKSRLQFVAHLADRTVPVGAKLKLFCIVDGPEPQIKWTKNGCGVVAGPRVKNGTKENNALIEILNVLPEDAGEWKCSAKNAAGEITSVCNLIVFAPPPVDIIPPTFSRPISGKLHALRCVLSVSLLLSSVFRMEIKTEAPRKARGKKRGQKKKETSDLLAGDTTPIFLTHLTNRTVEEGIPVKFSCFAMGPELQVKWFKNGESYTPTSPVKMSCEDGLIVLEFLNPRKDDSGRYKVNVFNASGTISSTAFLEIYSIKGATVTADLPPVFTSAMKDSFHPETNEIILECFVSNPPPQISWFRNNVEITNTDKFALISENNLRKLIISHPESLDSGLYSCKLHNSEQEQEVSCHVDVNSLIGLPRVKKEPKAEAEDQDLLPRKRIQQEDEQVAQKPQSRAEKMREAERNKLVFEVYLKNATANEGSTIKLMCCVRGLEPRVTWLRNGQEIPHDPIKYSTESRNGVFSLAVSNLTHSDAGEYSCRVENAINAIYSSAKVIVNEKVQKKELPMVISDKLLDFYDQKTNQLIFECMTRGSPKITWFRDNKPLQDERFDYFSDKSGLNRLIISNPRADDSGNYSCRIQDTNFDVKLDHHLSFDGRKIIRGRHLEKAQQEPQKPSSSHTALRHRDTRKKPYFTTSLMDRTAAEGSTIKLIANVMGDADSEVVWHRNHIPLESSSRHRTIFRDGLATLEIFGATPDDSAEYSCVVRNRYGQAESSSKLKVYEGFETTPMPPTFTRSIKDTYNINVDELVLECRVRGQPRPSITWYKDGEELDTHMNKKYEQQDSYDGFCRLLISKPTPTDNGIYICKADNPGHSDKIQHMVQFTGKDSSILERTHGFYHRDPNKPHFSTVLTDNLVPIGGTIGLQVEVHGPVDVQWLRGKDVLTSGDKVNTYAEEGTYTLAVSSATAKESGTYTCRATNAFGKSDSIAHVHVIAPATVKGGKPPQILDRPPKEMVLMTGDNLKISFRIQGDPKPQLYFLKGLRDLSKNSRCYKEKHDDYVRYNIEQCSLQDSGTYCIMARNRFGIDRAFVAVQVKARARSITPSREWNYTPITVDSTEVSYFKNPPEPIPAEPLVVDSGKNHVSLSWLKPPPGDAAPVIAYKVEAWLVGKDGGARWTELGVTPINSFDAFNLQQRCEYHFRVTPRNRYGWGPSVQTSQSVLVGVPVQMPEFTKILPGQLKALIEREITLECIVKGHPKPDVIWYKDGLELESEDRISCRSLGSVCKLTIVSVRSTDSGRYTCEATNRAGRVSTFARLLAVEDRKIFEADGELKRFIETDLSLISEMQPQFTMRLRDRRVQVTFPVRLTCQCIGLPLPEVVWFKNGKEVEQNDRFNVWNENNFYTLEILRTTLDDGGRYTVTARNEMGSVSCHCNLVVDKGIRAYIAPDFYCGLDPLYTFREGSEIRLSAQVEAYPSVGVTWHRDGAKLRPSRRIVVTLDHNGFVELVIADAKTSDAGIYTCVASNAVGQAESCCRVTIEGSSDDQTDRAAIPRVTEGDHPYSKEPMFITKPRSSEAYEGDTVIIHCEVIGDPKPDVVWLRDFLKPEYYKDAPHFHRVGDGPEYRLEIPRAKLDYTGTYSVIATNFHGEAKAIISLQIYAKDLDKVKSMDKGSIKHSNVETLPSFLSHLKDLRCCDGDAATLECRVIGQPEPNIFWEKDGRLVQMGNDFSSKYDGEKATLSLARIFPEDEGSYTCIASNTIGKTYSSAVLIVDVPEEKENLLSKQLNRPPGILLSAQSTPRSTPRTTPIRSSSPHRVSSMSFRSPCIDITSSKHLKFSAPKFYALPQNKVAEEGENVRFQCAIAGHPTPWSTWDMNGTIVTPTARITVKECDDLRILEIEQVTQEDAGLYRITLENDFGRIEATARLDVICCRDRSARMLRTSSASPRRAGVWSRRLMGNSTAIGGRLALACDFRRGTSTPARKFYHNGEEVEESERIKIADNVLVVDNVTVEDEGIYTCVAYTEDCIMTTSKCVTFADNPVNPPRIVKCLTPEEAQDIRTCEGAALDLELRVECSEVFDYTWFRDDKAIPDSDDMRYIDHGDGLLVLSIADPFVPDSGVYKCVITSPAGECESSCPVIVTECTHESSGVSEQPRPLFSKPPLPVVSHPGAEVAFSARISPPQSRISWYLNGREIGQNPSAHFQIEEEEDGLSILRVIGLQHDHSGEIKCVAETRADCDGRHDTQAIVYTSLAVLPEVPPSQCPAHILSGPQDCTTLIGGRIVLEAFFAGHPDPAVKWMRAGRIISETSNKTMSTTKGRSVLLLTDITADDSGKYTVEVANEHGGDTASASVAVEGPPEPPGGRPSVSPGVDRVAVAWCGPPYDGGCMITGFSLEMQEDDAEWKEVAQVVDSLAYTVKDLTPGLKYRFRVRAENTHGKSEPSLASDEILMNSPDVTDAEKSPVDVAPGGDFKSRFEMLEELGKGRFGVVYKVVERDTSRTLAAKVIKCIKSKDRVKVQEEISIMKSLQHPKLLQLAATFETTKEIIMVMEYITGGELFERVVADDFTLTERDCILFLRQICEGVSYMHEKCVVHLDLKPENIMCHTRNSHQIKIIDFGLAQRLTDNTPVRVLFGTPEFIPPEIINYEPIGFQSDMWSVGVICYVLLSGLSPFMGDSDVDTFTNITRADYDFEDEAFDAVSQDAKEFISGLLIHRKEERLTAQECLNSKWLSLENDNMSNVKLSTDKLKKFIIRRKWQISQIEPQQTHPVLAGRWVG
ncbi:muscle M-line assembly protein unc-89-like, partial [Phlebotomus argentipes]|uniref:muscle M-line assembly protein unc-89-like n=1 Tax=Phlebotomus argentipes TaxID=94469 RepID=UPI002892A675